MIDVFRPNSLLRVAAVMIVAIVAGCATQTGRPGESGPVDTQPPLAEPPPGPAPAAVHPGEVPPPVTQPPALPLSQYPKSLRESGASPGALALAKQAQDSRSARKYDAAVGQLERALRIEPKNPFIWQALAEAHLQLQHADQAESAAQKSNSLARGNPYLTAGNWRVIASARTLKSDGAGARLAASRADEISATLPAAATQ